ncbi:hypothetical protein T440DRAFT_516729 [Plenodomus tracheiphilus IPT5]|uniref:Uncharacterized protein n=1 Tax=Plenodomus tracheiphilus IPT5 TaxID=1408161 RepID=A0A6A7B9W3_9PLEO|nr:hypothetical protein T440DRAFT_516729 [Plenodomus tracheiphilus IPT5]
MIRNNTRPKTGGFTGRRTLAASTDEGRSEVTEAAADASQSEARHQMNIPVNLDAAAEAQNVSDTRDISSAPTTPLVKPGKVEFDTNETLEFSSLQDVNMRTFAGAESLASEAVKSIPSLQLDLEQVKLQDLRQTARNIEVGPQGDSVPIPPLTKYWDEEEWPYFSKDPVGSSLLIWKCLGYYHGDVDFPVLTDLWIEMLVIAIRLFVQLSPEDILICAASSEYLNEEIDMLLDEYAPHLWGMESDRSFNGQDDAGNVHGKVLVYENDADRKLLWLHLHQLTFLAAIRGMKDFGHNEKIKEGLREELGRWATESPAKCTVPARVYAPLLSRGEYEPQRGLKRKSSYPLLESEDSDKENEAPTPSFIQASSPSFVPPRTAVEEHPTKKREVLQDIHPVNEEPSTSKLTTPTYTGPSDLTGAILAYIHGYDDPSFDEASCLRDIELELVEFDPSVLRNYDHSNTFAEVLFAWVQYRCTIIGVKCQLSSFDKLSLVTQRVKKARLLARLRQARDDFLASCDFSRAEHVLFMGFAKLEDTIEERGAVMRQLQKGFAKLDEELLELGDWLGGGKFVLMGTQKTLYMVLFALGVFT